MANKKENCEELLKELRAYRNDMVARNYPFQQISDIITRWEMKEVKTVPDEDFLDQAEREKKELEESYQEAKRQKEERKSREWIKGYSQWKKK
jgi:hypothetical protein|tara:strand:- start:9023 stop:9301 length:279 start_codon:yes stop_codon:yes gene_type:complete